MPPVTATLGGRYLLEEPIGQGGMASVWRATDTVLGRHVAVKRLHRRFLDDPEQAARFEREASVVARLTHPAVVKLLDRGEDEDGVFLVFELVEGEDLKARIARDGKLAPREAASVCAQIARGLEHAHGQGVVHRDITARNILLTPDGHAKLADFGVAHEVEAAGLTSTGAMVGTSEYLAPEQAQGDRVDGRADVYALGVVLYECLTGELPFTGAGPLAVAIRHLSEPVPDPRSIAPAVPESLAAAVLTATAKDPDRRFPTAGAFADLLEAVAVGRDVTMTMPVVHEEATGEIARPQGRRRGRRALVVGGVVAVAGAAAAAALVLTGVVGGKAAEPTSASLVTLPMSVTDYDPEGDGRENPDLVAYAHDGDPTTAWRTEGYLNTGDLSRHQKSGVGLKLTLATPAEAREMVLTSPTVGARFQVRAGESTTPIASGTTSGRRQRVRLPAGDPQTQYVLWFTNVPRDPNAFTIIPELAAYRAYVGEVDLRGVAKGS